MNEKIIIALDSNNLDQGRFILEELSGTGVWIKIGMEAFYGLGPLFLHEAKEKNFKIFLDLKLHDIPNTVAGALGSLLKLPMDMVNVHCAGGREMMLKASETMLSLKNPPLLIGVTQLTSTNTLGMNQDQRIQGTVEESVIHYAKLARECGLQGVVSSPREVPLIKEICGKDFLAVTPGIRPIGSAHGDQKRVTTPKEAFSLGADFIVIGRPVTNTPSPKLALNEILKGLQ